MSTAPDTRSFLIEITMPTVQTARALGYQSLVLEGHSNTMPPPSGSLPTCTCTFGLSRLAARSFTLKVVEQAPRRSEVDGVKSFCESVIDRTQCVTRLTDPTIAVAQARQARRRAQFP